MGILLCIFQFCTRFEKMGTNFRRSASEKSILSDFYYYYFVVFLFLPVLFNTLAFLHFEVKRLK